MTDEYKKFGKYAAAYNNCRPSYPTEVLLPVLLRAGFGSEARKKTDIAVIGCHTGDKDCAPLLETGFRHVLGIEPDIRMVEQCSIDNPRFSMMHNSANDFSLPGKVQLFFFAQSYHTVHLNGNAPAVHENIRKNAAPNSSIMVLSYNPDIEHESTLPIHKILSELSSYRKSATPLIDSKSALFHPVFMQYVADLNHCKVEKINLLPVTVADPREWLQSYSFGIKAEQDEIKEFEEVVEKLEQFRGHELPYKANVYTAPFREKALSPETVAALDLLKAEMTKLNAENLGIDIGGSLMERYTEIQKKHPELVTPSKLESLAASINRYT